MLWDPALNTKEGEEGDRNNVSVTPILVPLQNNDAGMGGGGGGSGGGGGGSREISVPVLVPDVQELKDQFQQQQNMLTKIKETIKQNESQLNSRGKQIEVYANKLSQIRARTKNASGKKLNPARSSENISGSPTKALTKRTSKENLAKPESSEVKKSPLNSPKTLRKGKITELKKCLEENKIKFEQRTGREQTETKKIESLVEQLRMQLEERDKTIQDLHRTIEAPKSLPRKSKQKSETVASKMTQTHQARPSEESNEIIALQKKIYDLETNVLDLEENLKEKESVIEARTQAVTLLSQDLSLKGKSTLDNLEETRQEMRTMQNNFIAMEDQLKKDLMEKDNRLTDFEDRHKKLQSTNFELSLKNAELQEKLVKMQERFAELEAERKSLSSRDETLAKLATLTKELDSRNKAMIKMKIEHKNKLKSLNETLESLKGASDDKAEIFRLCKLVEELENVKMGLENRVAELEDEKATEKKLKDQINELEIVVQKQKEDLSSLQQTIAILEKEKSDLAQINHDQNVIIDDLHSKMTGFNDGVVAADGDVIKAEELAKVESEYNRRLEYLKDEHRKEIDMLESYYNSKLESPDRRELEEYRISAEINNIHVEEQIDLLIREKQQLLEKLKSLSGVSPADLQVFERVERSELKADKEFRGMALEGDGLNPGAVESSENRISHLQRIVNEQQDLIAELEKSVLVEKGRIKVYESKIGELENGLKELEETNASFKEQIQMTESYGKTEKSQKSNFNVKKKVKKIEMELAEARKALLEQSKKMEDLNEKLAEKDEIIKKYTERIELFEKDDWDRQNHWQNVGEDMENVQELQKKCLSLENSLIELNEQFERLRKENIEVVHLLSEEKVKTRKLLDERGAKTAGEDQSFFVNKIQALNQLLETLESKVEVLESKSPVESPREKDSWEIADLEEKLEWTNVVLTSKETEIFRLQNLLEDSSKAMEDLEMTLNDAREKLLQKEKQIGEMTELLRVREIQLQEVSSNIANLNEKSSEAKDKLAQSEFQFQELLARTSEVEKLLTAKTSQIKELQDVLTHKDLDITNLKNHLEGVNKELTKNFQERLDKLENCLKQKESDFEAVWAEKKNLEIAIKDLMSEKEAIHNQKVFITKENEKLQGLLAVKEQLLLESGEQLKSFQSASLTKAPAQDIEDLKIKMKKLAANLKKKAQNETELTNQVKNLEAVVDEKSQFLEKLEADLKDVTEKWNHEKSEKDQVRNELVAYSNQQAGFESEKASLNERLTLLEKELEDRRSMHESQVQQLQEEIQNAFTTFQPIEQQYRDKIKELETKLQETTKQYQSVMATLKETENAMVDVQLNQEEALKKLAEITGKFEEIKFKHDQILLEKSELENKMDELKKVQEGSIVEKTAFDAKLQENMAVIENLEFELTKAQDHVKYVEEKLFVSEERRLSLESKNEEMCRKITENSQNLITIDDLATRVDELLKSEKSLMESVKVLETANAELKHSSDEAEGAKQKLENEVKGLTEKVTIVTEELKQLKDVDLEKSGAIKTLTKEVDKTKGENKQILEEYEKLNRDYEQFEVDFKENLENSQNIEKSLRHKIEELLSENASLQEKLNLMTDDKSRSDEKVEEAEEDPKKRKKKKSVTFRTDEVEYIKDLKQQLHTYDAGLKQANEEIERLKAELFRKTLKEEVTNVVVEAQNKAEDLKSVSGDMFSSVVEPVIQKAEAKYLQAVPSDPETGGEKQFDASMFFGSNESSQSDGLSFFDSEMNAPSEQPSQSSEFDSLMWDDGWGTDGQLEEEYLTGKIEVSDSQSTSSNHYEEKIKALETETNALKAEVDKLTKELQDQTAKYTKALKKLKEQKIVCEKLQTEISRYKNNDGLGDLNVAIMDELKSQIEALEKKERDYLKALENHNLEKEALLKKIDVLNAGNEKFLEMKERQDNDVEVWQRKNDELLREIAELRQKVEQPLAAPLDDNALAQQNRELMNKVEALEWKNCELMQLIEEREELLEEMSSRTPATATPLTVPVFETNERGTEEKSVLQKEIEELKNVKELLEKRLTDEESKNVSAMDKLNEQLTALASENETLQDILGEMKSKGPAMSHSKIVGLKQKIVELEDLLKVKDLEIDQLKNLTMHLNEEMSSVNKNLVDLQTQKEMDSNKYQDILEDLEKTLRLKEEEIQVLKQQLAGKEVASQFQTIDLTQGEKSSPLEDLSEEWRQKIVELEDLLRLKEETLLMHSTFVQESGKEIDHLKMRNLQLEEFVRLRDNELNQLRSMSWNVETENETETLRTKVHDMEELIRFKDNEIFQIQSVKETEIQDLNVRISNLENLLKINENQQDLGLQQKIFELENILHRSEEESGRLQLEKVTEIDALRQNVRELENLLVCKNMEINQLMVKLAELEKSYNDSKVEIERLLNEEKLNTEEKFVEPFQNNIQIPVAYELEAISRTLDEEKQKADNLQFELSDKDKVIEKKSDEIEALIEKVTDLENRLQGLSDVESRQKIMAEESYQMKAQLEKIITDLQRELDTSNLQLSETKRELEQYQNSEDEVRLNLKSQIAELENELLESTEKKDSEIMELKSVLDEKTNFYESLLQSKREEEMKWTEKAMEGKRMSEDLEKEVERLRLELASKETEIANLSQLVNEERFRIGQMSDALDERGREVADLRQTLTQMQVEIASFRNFEKQVKELRMSQIKGSGPDIAVTSEGEPDLSGWTEHELAELSTKLQSDLDTALYLLHQRDVRCDELTFELMQLIEERDTLQLRLSTALRINEELRSLGKSDRTSSSHSLQECKDLVDQSNDRQREKEGVPCEDLRQLASKISELHSISYLRDKTVKDDSVQRHSEQMNLLSRVSDSDVALGRDSQSSPTVLLNWMRGKVAAPKVMHI